MNIEKPFTEMSSSELFAILTGEKGVMEQMTLQNILKEYVDKYGNTTDLVTMVRIVAEESERNRYEKSLNKILTALRDLGKQVADIADELDDAKLKRAVDGIDKVIDTIGGAMESH